MKWLKRSLWLAAWGVWVWLGFGLARELPRDLEVVCKLPVDQADYQIGFLKGTDHVAVVRRTDTWEPLISVFDAATGELIRETKSPLFRGFAWFPDDGDDPPLVYANVFETIPPGHDRGLREYNLATGVWRKVCDEHHNIVGIDPRTRIALCIKPNVVVSAFTFLDLETGKPLFVREVPSGWGAIPLAQIIKDAGVAVLPLAIWEKGAPRGEAVKLEIWRLGPPVTLERTINVTGHQSLLNDTPGGLLALPRDGTPSALDVYDLKANRWIYRGPSDAYDHPNSKYSGNAWTLSPTGKTATNGLGIWNIETGRRIWKASFHEIGMPDRKGGIRVLEQWYRVWEKWLPDFIFETYAWRDIDDGKLLLRAAIVQPSFPSELNDARTLAVAQDGTVYRMPPPINWKLLAICQSILASPLVFLWALHRWRAARLQRALASIPSVQP